MKDESLETIEVAILGLMQEFCDCPVNSTKFYNSTSTCSSQAVTFTSTLAHASDDGSVTATVLIEIFEARLSKEENPTITIDGKELAVYLPLDEDNNLSSPIFLYSTGIVSVALMIVVASMIIVCG